MPFLKPFIDVGLNNSLIREILKLNYPWDFELKYPDNTHHPYRFAGVHRLSWRGNGRGAAPQGTLSLQGAQGQDVWQMLYQDPAQLLARQGVSGMAGLFCWALLLASFEESCDDVATRFQKMN